MRMVELSVYEYTSSVPYVKNMESCAAPWILDKNTKRFISLKPGHPVGQRDNLCRFRMNYFRTFFPRALHPASTAGTQPIHEVQEDWSSSMATLTTSGMYSHPQEKQKD